MNVQYGYIPRLPERDLPYYRVADCYSENRQNVPKIGHKTISNILDVRRILSCLGRWNELIMASNSIQLHVFAAWKVEGRRGIFNVINLSLLENFNY